MTEDHRPSYSPFAIGLLAVALALLAACDMARFAAGSTIGVIERGAPAMQRVGDTDLAAEAIPASIGTMEAVMEVVPDDPRIRILLARSYASYGFGFLVDEMEAAYYNDDEQRGEHYRARASMAFLRAKEITLGTLTLWEDDDGGAEGAMSRGVVAWTEYLQQFDDAEDYGPALFWGAYAWAQYIGVNRDDVNALADLPYVNAMADHVLALDETFMGHAPHALKAGLVGTAPVQFGGRPDEARREFDAAIAATERHNFMYIVMQARIVGIAIQDRAFYRTLLEEVLEGDPGIDPDNRLLNLLAKRRAERYLAEIDMLFEPEGTPRDEGEGEPAAAEAPAAAADSAP